MSGLLVLADKDKLDDYVGLLSNAIIPVWDATTGLPYKINAENILAGHDWDVHDVDAAGGPTETISALHGKVVILVLRGSSKAGNIITTGTPGGFQVKWDNVNDVLTAPAGNDWLGGEPLSLIFKV